MSKFIAFDMDGTIFSSENMILPAYDRGITNFNKQNQHNKVLLPPLKDLLSLLGLPIIQIYNKLFPNLSMEEKATIRDLISVELISSIKNKEGTLFSGVSETLGYLYKCGYKLLMASNGLKSYLETILSTYNLLELFEPIITLNNTNICDKGDILLEYQKIHKLDARYTIMVGDRESDMEAAKKLSCKFIACNYGHGNNGEIESAKIIVHSFPEILNWIDF